MPAALVPTRYLWQFARMLPTRNGSVRLFRFAGVEVFLHWSWFIIAMIAITQRNREYSSMLFNVLEYLALFAIVLLHEFGHSLACRQVGGRADQIVLWPLGGVAYVAPPQRPGATLWSIAAGPLVNVVLLPVFFLAWWGAGQMGWNESLPDVYRLLKIIAIINTALLVFNMLPIYPLDGGQILRALLWFPFGRARSLMIAAIIGFVGVALLFGLALLQRSMWTGIMAAFVLMNCVSGFRHARQLVAVEKLPRRAGFACPECKASPPVGNFWGCGKCRNALDAFASPGMCPHCGEGFPATTCPDCGAARPVGEWVVAPPPMRRG